MTTRRVVGALLLALGAGSLASGDGLLAFNATDVGLRATTVSVNNAGNAYNTWKAVAISASTLTGYTDQTGVIVWNNGTTPTRFTWTTQTDPSAVVTSAASCSGDAQGRTVVGASCAIRFTGPARAIGSYTFTGVVKGEDVALFRSELNAITIAVTYCALPPC